MVRRTISKGWFRLPKLAAAGRLIAGTMLLATASQAHAAFIDLDPSYGGDAAVGRNVLTMIPGAAEFNALSRPMPIVIAFGPPDTVAETFAEASQEQTWRPNSFPQAADPLILPDLPQSAGWVPLVGGLALIAYRMRRGDRRFRYRSAV